MSERTALVFEERRYSLPVLEALAAGLAATLTKRGVIAGKRVALMTSTRPEFVIALRAIWRLGATVVLLSPAWRRGEVEHALALTNPTHAVGDQDPSTIALNYSVQSQWRFISVKSSVLVDVDVSFPRQSERIARTVLQTITDRIN